MLKGYEGGNVQVASAPKAVDTSAANIALAKEGAKGMQNLTDRLEQFTNYKFKQLEAETTEKAVQDAKQDSIDGKPFASKSVATVYGRTYNNAATATFASKADIAITERSNQLAEEHFLNPIGYNESMREYISGMQENAPTPELASVIQINGAKVRTSTYGQLHQEERKRIHRDHVETFEQNVGKDINRIIGLEAKGDPESIKTANSLKETNLLYMNSLLNEGVIDEAQAKAYTKDANFKIIYGVDTRKMEELLMQPSLAEAHKFLVRKTAEQDPRMDIEENDEYSSQLKTMYSKAVKARDAAAKKEGDFANQIVNEQVEIMKDGGITTMSADELRATREKATSKSAIRALDIQLAINKYFPDWRGKTLQQQEDMIAQLENSERNPVTQELIGQMRTDIERRNTRAKDDVVGLAIKEGYQDIPTVGMSASDGVNGLLQGASEMNTDLMESVYGTSNLLTKQDAKSWKQYFEAPGNTEQKMATLGTIAEFGSVYPEKAQKLFNQIGGKDAKTFTFAAKMAANNNLEAASIMMKGKNSGVKLDKKKDFETEVNSQLAGVYSHDKGGLWIDRDREGIVNYNRGILADGGDQLNGSDAVEATYGTVKNYNNKDLIIPRDVTTDQFDEWIDNVIIPGSASLTAAIRQMNNWGSKGNIELHQAGNGKYRIWKRNGGKGMYITDPKTGKDKILDYYKGKTQR